MDHDTKTRFRVTFGLFGLTKSILDRSLEVVFFNFNRDIRTLPAKVIPPVLLEG